MLKSKTKEQTKKDQKKLNRSKLPRDAWNRIREKRRRKYYLLKCNKPGQNDQNETSSNPHERRFQSRKPNSEDNRGVLAIYYSLFPSLCLLRSSLFVFFSLLSFQFFFTQ